MGKVDYQLQRPGILRAAQPEQRSSPSLHSAWPSPAVAAFADVVPVRAARRSRLGQTLWKKAG